MFFFFMLQALWASEIQKIEVSSVASAIVSISGRELPTPTFSVQGNEVEFLFENTALKDSKIDIQSSHPLLRRVSCYSLDSKKVKVRMIVAGSIENLRERITLKNNKDQLEITLDYPPGTPASVLAAEEQKPMSTYVTYNEQKKNPQASFGTLFLIIGIVTVSLFASFFGFRFLQKKNKIQGTRKFLIENLSYRSLGAKTGVCLLKVGNEFILVGVTPGNINFLVSLNSLKDQYKEESRFEREAFEKAVEQEFQKIQKSKINV